MNKSVVIIGASGHGKVVADIIKKSGDEVVGFLDDNPHLPKELSGIPVLGTVGLIIQNIKILCLWLR